MEELWATTISKRSLLSTWCWDWEVECRSSLRLWLERLLLSM
jgi:hypothetical protein